MIKLIKRQINKQNFLFHKMRFKWANQTNLKDEWSNFTKYLKKRTLAKLMKNYGRISLFILNNTKNISILKLIKKINGLKLEIKKNQFKSVGKYII